jgi:hypothetical protein
MQSTHPLCCRFNRPDELGRIIRKGKNAKGGEKDWHLETGTEFLYVSQVSFQANSVYRPD